MLPYLLVLGLVMFWVILEHKSLGRKSFWFPLIVLAVFAGVRSTDVGSDSRNYTNSFVYNLNVYNFEFHEDIEFGYQLFEYVLLNFTHNYFWLFFITALLVIYCYLYIIKIYSVNYTMSIFLFFTLGTYTFFFNGLRQGMAMAIFVFAVPYILERRPLAYIGICFLASLFHVSALFMIPFYFIMSLKIKPIYKVLVTFISSVLVSGFLVSYVADTNPRYEGYGKVSDKSGGTLILAFYSILMILLYILSRVYSIKDKKFNELLTLYAVGVCFVIPLAFLGTTASGPQRLLSYFTWILVLLLPIVLKKINNTSLYIFSIIIALTYFILTTYKFSHLYPYTINPVFEIF